MEKALYGVYTFVFCIRNLTSSLYLLVRFLIRHNSSVNTVRAHFPWSILYIYITAHTTLNQVQFIFYHNINVKKDDFWSAWSRLQWIHFCANCLLALKAWPVTSGERIRITKVGLRNSIPGEGICLLNATVHQLATKTAATPMSSENETSRWNDDFALKLWKQIENWLLWSNVLHIKFVISRSCLQGITTGLLLLVFFKVKRLASEDYKIIENVTILFFVEQLST